jgi:hypothetical protein
MTTTNDHDETFDVVAEFKTNVMGMLISKTIEIVTNFKAHEVMEKFNLEAMTNGVEHLPVTYSPIMTPPPNVHVGENSHFNELENLGSLDTILDKKNMQVLPKSNMHLYRSFQCQLPKCISFGYY